MIELWLAIHGGDPVPNAFADATLGMVLVDLSSMATKVATRKAIREIGEQMQAGFGE
jgi:hypothetical protein